MSDKLFAHRYEEVEVDCKAELRKHPNESGWLGAHAEVLVCLGRLEEALWEYQRANELHIQQLNPESQPYLKRIGALFWLLDRREEAIRTFRAAVDGILDGSIKFGDSAGGVSQGLLLWYAGVTCPDAAAKEHAQMYLRELSKHRRIEYWPGPLAMYALREKTQAVVLTDLGETTNLKALVRRAKRDLYVRRQLVRTLFYFAARDREEGREEECHAGMVKCASLENPIIEVEWYLAQAEAEQTPRS